jgi:GAF domain-containing protein
MKFLNALPLRFLGIGFISLMVIIYSAEYLLIVKKYRNVENQERKLDFVRRQQLANHEINTLTDRLLAGEQVNPSLIQANVIQQDRFIKIIGEGGKIERSDLVLKPLERLPAITYTTLLEYWSEYKETTLALLNGFQVPVEASSLAEEPTSTATSSSTTIPDSDEESDDVFEDDEAFMEVSEPTPSSEKAIASASTAQEANPTERVMLSKSLIQKQQSLAITLTYWFDTLMIDLEEEILNQRQSIAVWGAGIILFDIALLILAFLGFKKTIMQPIVLITNNTDQHLQTKNLPPNELGILSKSINEILENLKDASDFVGAIAKGDLSIDYKSALDPTYQPGKNQLADSLIDMQQKLIALGEEERKRQWINDGVAKFVEILRDTSNNIQILGDKIISAIVKYTGANQGCLFTLNDETPNQHFLELISLFAFDAKKFEQRKIKLGEGLLGQTFLEQETTYLTQIPDEYIRITSGLGDAGPKAVLIVPLKVDREVLGIIELASFNEFQPHEIAFVERLSELIASTMSNVKAAQKNQMLIEQFHIQTEQMRAQEEEMRQNMEELHATQEEIARKELGYIEKITTLESKLEDTVPAQEVRKLRAILEQKELDYQAEIAALKQNLNDATARDDDWQVAEDTVKALKVNLEALKITEEELKKKLL